MTDIYICKGVCPVTPLKPHKNPSSWEIPPKKSLILSQTKSLRTTQIKGLTKGHLADKGQEWKACSHSPVFYLPM